MVASSIRPIALIGIKAVGKTSIGQSVASSLDVPFFDLDSLVIDRFCDHTYSSKALITTARDVYLRTGKEGFADLEVEALQRIRRFPRHILSTGGGISDNERALTLLADTWFVILISGNLKDQFDRIMVKGIPPFLSPTDPWSDFTNLAQRRLARYKSIADVVFDVSTLSQSESSTIVRDRVKEYFDGR